MTLIRTVLAVALAVALVAVSLPAVDDARANRSAATVESDLTGLERAARALATREDATATGVPGARRRVTVRLPRASWASAAVAWVRVEGRPVGVDREGDRGTDADDDRDRPADATGRRLADASAVSYRVAGGGVRTVRLRGIRLRAPGGSLTLREPGRHALVLSLRRDDGPVVVVRRA